VEFPSLEVYSARTCTLFPIPGPFTHRILKKIFVGNVFFTDFCLFLRATWPGAGSTEQKCKSERKKNPRLSRADSSFCSSFCCESS
jgi:hypothetical protein